MKAPIKNLRRILLNDLKLNISVILESENGNMITVEFIRTEKEEYLQAANAIGILEVFKFKTFQSFYKYLTPYVIFHKLEITEVNDNN